MLRISPIRLLLPYSFRCDLSGVSRPQLEVQLCQETLEPPSVTTRFHPHPHLGPDLCQSAIELLGFFPVPKAPLLHLPSLSIDQCDLLEARVIVTTYNQHV